ncbi:MAG: AEC family transporter [Pseudomonadota bacterium]
MLDILGLILPLFGLILLGFIGARLTHHPMEAMGWLNTFILYFALPALFYKLLSRTPIDQLASGHFIAVNIGVTFTVFAITFALAMLASRRNVAESTVQGLAGAYGNIGYMGPALAILAFGEDAAIPVAIIFCFENVMHFALAPALMAVSGTRQQPTHRLILETLKRIVTHPLMLATGVGVLAAAAQVAPPVPLARLIEYLAQAAAPCALFAMGVTLALRPLKRVPPALGYIVPMKLVVHPLLMYLGLSYFGNFDGQWVFVAVLLASLPTATNVFVIAQQYGVWLERASASVLVSTSASVFSVAALLYGITTGAIPPDLFP